MAGGNFFDGTFFGGGFFGSIKSGTGGIDPGGDARRVPIKPTGLVDRPRKPAKEGRKDVADRVDESRNIEADVAEKLAKEFSDQTLRLRGEAEEEAAQAAQAEIARMTQEEVAFEIGVLLRKKLKTQEDELLLLMLMAASV